MAKKVTNILKGKTFKDISFVMLISLIQKPVELLKGFFVAKYLGPESFGIFKALEIIYMLKKYGGLGFTQVAIREASNFNGKNDSKNSELVTNVALTSEIVFAATIFILALSSSLFIDSSYTIFIILASIGMFLSRISGIFLISSVIKKDFIFNSKAILFSSLITAFLVIISVPHIKILSPILAQILIPLILIGIYLKYYKHKIVLVFNKKEFLRITKIGIPLVFGTLSIAGFKYAERLLVLSLFGLTYMGIYGLAEMVYMQISSFLKMPVKVRMVDIHEEIGRGNFIKVHNMILRETLILIAISIVPILITWHTIGIFIQIFLPKWIDAIYPIQLFLMVIPFQLLVNYLIQAVHSALVNKQKITPIYRNISTLMLVCASLTFNYFNKLTFEYFIIINILGYAFYSISILLLYKKHFYNKYILES